MRNRRRNFLIVSSVNDWHFPSAGAPLDTRFEANHRYTSQAQLSQLQDWTATLLI